MNEDDELEGSVVEEFHEDKIYCANCVNCKVVKVALGNGSQYQLRVRCSVGKWQKKSGEEKLHKYFTLSRRILDQCDSYNPMGDSRSFLKELKAVLPTKDEVYSKG